MPYDGHELIKTYVPNDSSQQGSSIELVKQLMKKQQFENVMDLGCGTGNSADFFKSQQQHIKWVGLDVSSSPEVQLRTRTNENFYFYDGINVPFPNNHFDLIYSHQVFEHVQRPFKLIEEIHRVMKQGAYFVGQVSYLEAFHSLSTFNYTPYGFNLLLESASLKLLILRPGIDSISLNVNNRLVSKIPIVSGFCDWRKKESPFNFLINMMGKITKKSNQEINLLKLLTCGQFCFIAQK